ncbi:MAG: helix-turn-helix transcriptional regulator [Candidatus Hodarchaeota archaeon]
MKSVNYLVGADRRGGRSYQVIVCEICGGSLFISKEAGSGVCAVCVQMGYSKATQTKVNPAELWGAIEKGRGRRYRRENKMSQDQAAQVFGITRKTYSEVENGKISRMIRRKVEKKLAQVEQVG